ncbi:hypothetical protein TpMuguga_01g00531 [Theileria parva strain Muguga]|uniref:Uncharacterized protein n=1 Tax=Theileria parva TaxID=5875 RepID=Q4N8E0_THEPA|nr:uncharacterized protein TpMuguga_01g00531 [Theileria parva strain Muguga]EAN33768.1 hypothetical protein TpMuguga_01g00531 [Theileria parva strain Muguga]|eukprot:XP_766051.1 hypothetical protein [Theileria parva strain Muguga]
MKYLALGLVYALASVYAGPLLLNADLLANGNSGLAVLHHAAFTHTDDAHCERRGNLRYLHLVPNVTQNVLYDGLASGALGYTPVLHRGLTPNFATGEVMTELVGLSDCKTWHVALVGFWARGYHYFRYLGGVKEGTRWNKLYFDGLDALVEFVRSKLPVEHFRGLLAKGVAAGDFMLRLHEVFARSV